MRLHELLYEEYLNEYKKIDYILYRNKLKSAAREFNKSANGDDEANLLSKIAIDHNLSPRLFQNYLIDNNIISSATTGN